jgi:hypothetical protein
MLVSRPNRSAASKQPFTLFLSFCIVGLLRFVVGKLHAVPTFYREEDDRVVEHLVLFKLKEETTEVQKQAVVDKLKELADMEGISEFSVGLNHSYEGKSKGFEVGMRIGFESQEALDRYLPSEKHQSVVGQIRQHFADVIVLDYTW